MSGDGTGSVTMAWGDGEYRFRLAIGQLRELQAKVNEPRVKVGAKPLGPRGLLRALIAGEEWIDDAREIMRLGLIGGGNGMTPPKALNLVQQYVDGRPIAESVVPATVILMAAVSGVEGDDVGKKEAAETAVSERTTTDLSPSPQSSGTAPQWDASASQTI